MKATISQSLLDRKVCQHVRLPLIESVISPDLIQQVLTDCQAWEKKLNRQAIIYLLSATHRSPDLSTSDVWRRLLEGWKALRLETNETIPTPGAVSQRFQDLGVTPIGVNVTKST
jgi:hypothetical protein